MVQKGPKPAKCYRMVPNVAEGTEYQMIPNGSKQNQTAPKGGKRYQTAPNGGGQYRTVLNNTKVYSDWSMIGLIPDS